MTTMKTKLQKKTTLSEVIVKQGRKEETITDPKLAGAIRSGAGFVNDVKTIEPLIKGNKAIIERRARDLIGESGTVTFIADGISCRVTFRYECIIPQENIPEVRRLLGKRFRDLVTRQVKYTGTKTLIDGVGEGEFGDKVPGLLEVKDLSPQFKFSEVKEK